MTTAFTEERMQQLFLFPPSAQGAAALVALRELSQWRLRRQAAYRRLEDVERACVMAAAQVRLAAGGASTFSPSHHHDALAAIDRLAANRATLKAAFEDFELCDRMTRAASKQLQEAFDHYGMRIGATTGRLATGDWDDDEGEDDEITLGAGVSARETADVKSPKSETLVSSHPTSPSGGTSTVAASPASRGARDGATSTSLVDAIYRTIKSGGGDIVDHPDGHTFMRGLCRFQALVKGTRTRSRLRALRKLRAKLDRSQLSYTLRWWHRYTASVKMNHRALKRRGFAGLQAWASLQLMKRQAFGVLVRRSRETSTLRRCLVMWHHYTQYLLVRSDELGERNIDFTHMRPCAVWDEFMEVEAMRRKFFLSGHTTLVNRDDPVMFKAVFWFRWRKYVEESRRRKRNWFIAEAHHALRTLQKHFAAWNSLVCFIAQRTAMENATKQYYLRRWQRSKRCLKEERAAVEGFAKVRTLALLTKWRRRTVAFRCDQAVSSLLLSRRRIVALWVLGSWAPKMLPPCMDCMIRCWRDWRVVTRRARDWRYYIAARWAKRQQHLKAVTFTAWMRYTDSAKQRGETRLKNRVKSFDVFQRETDTELLEEVAASRNRARFASDALKVTALSAAAAAKEQAFQVLKTALTLDDVTGGGTLDGATSPSGLRTMSNLTTSSRESVISPTASIKSPFDAPAPTAPSLYAGDLPLPSVDDLRRDARVTTSWWQLWVESTAKRGDRPSACVVVRLLMATLRAQRLRQQRARNAALQNLDPALPEETASTSPAAGAAPPPSNGSSAKHDSSASPTTPTTPAAAGTASVAADKIGASSRVAALRLARAMVLGAGRPLYRDDVRPEFDVSAMEDLVRENALTNRFLLLRRARKTDHVLRKVNAKLAALQCAALDPHFSIDPRLVAFSPYQALRERYEAICSSAVRDAAARGKRKAKLAVPLPIPPPGRVVPFILRLRLADILDDAARARIALRAAENARLDRALEHLGLALRMLRARNASSPGSADELLQKLPDSVDNVQVREHRSFSKDALARRFKQASPRRVPVVYRLDFSIVNVVGFNPLFLRAQRAAAGGQVRAEMRLIASDVNLVHRVASEKVFAAVSRASAIREAEDAALEEARKRQESERERSPELTPIDDPLLAPPPGGAPAAPTMPLTHDDEGKTSSTRAQGARDGVRIHRSYSSYFSRQEFLRSVAAARARNQAGSETEGKGRRRHSVQCRSRMTPPPLPRLADESESDVRESDNAAALSRSQQSNALTSADERRSGQPRSPSSRGDATGNSASDRGPSSDATGPTTLLAGSEFLLSFAVPDGEKTPSGQGGEASQELDLLSGPSLMQGVPSPLSIVTPTPSGGTGRVIIASRGARSPHAAGASDEAAAAQGRGTAETYPPQAIVPLQQPTSSGAVRPPVSAPESPKSPKSPSSKTRQRSRDGQQPAGPRIALEATLKDPATTHPVRSPQRAVDQTNEVSPKNKAQPTATPVLHEIPRPSAHDASPQKRKGADEEAVDEHPQLLVTAPPPAVGSAPKRSVSRPIRRKAPNKNNPPPPPAAQRRPTVHAAPVKKISLDVSQVRADSQASWRTAADDSGRDVASINRLLEVTARYSGYLQRSCRAQIDQLTSLVGRLVGMGTAPPPPPVVIIGPSASSAGTSDTPRSRATSAAPAAKGCMCAVHTDRAACRSTPLYPEPSSAPVRYPWRPQSKRQGGHGGDAEVTIPATGSKAHKGADSDDEMALNPADGSTTVSPRRLIRRARGGRDASPTVTSPFPDVGEETLAIDPPLRGHHALRSPLHPVTLSAEGTIMQRMLSTALLVNDEDEYRKAFAFAPRQRESGQEASQGAAAGTSMSSPTVKMTRNSGVARPGSTGGAPGPAVSLRDDTDLEEDIRDFDKWMKHSVVLLRRGDRDAREQLAAQQELLSRRLQKLQQATSDGSGQPPQLLPKAHRARIAAVTSAKLMSIHTWRQLNRVVSPMVFLSGDGGSTRSSSRLLPPAAGGLGLRSRPASGDSTLAAPIAALSMSSARPELTESEVARLVAFLESRVSSSMM